MDELKKNRIVTTFAELRREGKKALLPFLTAGYPDGDATEALLREFERRGVRMCELGFPFSDPVADGPVIQASYTRALAAGLKVGDIFHLAAGYRKGGGEMALAAMVSYSIIFRHGVESFLRDASVAGFDGLIIPDLPVEEAGELTALAGQDGLANIPLAAPTTSPARRQLIARQARGFIYYISVAGITGQRDRLPEATLAAVAELRAQTDTPVCVGFGISNPATVAQVCQVADGAIVGSAIVHRLTEDLEQHIPRAQLVRRAGDFVELLLSPLKA